MAAKTGKALLAGVAAGALVGYFLDPQTGRRRRALARDQVVHLRAVLPRDVSGAGQRLAGSCRGAWHAVAGLTSGCRESAPVDAATLTQRVESELGPDPMLRMTQVNFDAADGVVRVRGQAADERMAERIVQRTAEVPGVRSVISLMRLPDGTPAGGMAGDLDYLDAGPRALLHGEALRDAMRERWPAVTDSDILASDGHLGKMTAAIAARTGEAPEAVRVALEEILLEAV